MDYGSRFDSAFAFCLREWCAALPCTCIWACCLAQALCMLVTAAAAELRWASRARRRSVGRELSEAEAPPWPHQGELLGIHLCYAVMQVCACSLLQHAAQHWAGKPIAQLELASRHIMACV